MKTRIGKIIFPVIMVALLAAKGNPPPEEPATVVCQRPSTAQWWRPRQRLMVNTP